MDSRWSALLIVSALAATVGVMASATAPAQVSVVDGDTIRYGAETVRLLDIDAPETGGARCAAERELGEAAAARLKELLAAARQVTVEVRERRDYYGRALGRVYVDGEDVSVRLLREGHARPYQRGRSREGWC